jgi:hypothetical protein
VWQANRISCAARFSSEGWLPETARHNRILYPGKTFGFPEYKDVTGSLAGRWTNNQFRLDLSARAPPSTAPSQPTLPSELLLGLAGDTNRIVVNQALVRFPFIQAQLSSGATFNYEGTLLNDQASVELSADLAKEPWLDATGDLNARILLRPGSGHIPNAEFNLTISVVDIW